MTPSSATTQRGAPPFGNPRISSSLSVQRWKHLAGLSGGESKEGAAAPSLVVAGEGYIREGPHRKGPSLMRFFGHFLSAQKVTRGMGPGRPHTPGVRGRNPRKPSTRMAPIRKKKYFFPTHPPMGESALHRPDVPAQAKRKRGCGGSTPAPPYGHILTSTRRRPSTLATAIARTTAAPTAPQAAGGMAATPR